VTLQKRTLMASVIALLIIIAMTVLLLVQFSRTVSANASINDQLSPAADASSALTLEQANANLALADATLLDRGDTVQEYRRSIGQATTLLDEIDVAIKDEEVSLSQLVTASRAAQQQWIEKAGTPVVAALDAGRRTRAMKLIASDPVQASYAAMTTASRDLSHAINMRRDEAVASANGFATLLGIILVLICVVITAMVAFFILGVQRWVLGPLSSIRHDLTRAAREPGHSHPVRNVGPPELMALAKDGEQLRRELVKEIDEAQAARTALMQDAPLVAAMRSELSAPPIPNFEELAIAGMSMASEGVIAGDWWEVIEQADGSVVLMIADVSGHDPVAGVTALRVRSVMRSALAGGEGLTKAIERSAESMNKDGHFVTALVFSINPDRSVLTWCNAGHVPGCVVTYEGNVHVCMPTGPIISSLGGSWETQSVEFSAGDSLLCYTDGLVEIDDVLWDDEALASYLEAVDPMVRCDPEELIANVLSYVRNRARVWNRDDVTVMAASRLL